MPGLHTGNEADLVGVAKVLGLRDAEELGDLRPSRLMKLTQRELLDAARVLGLSKVSKLNKQALLAKVWEALQVAGVIPIDEAAGQPAVPVSKRQGERRPPPPTNGDAKGGSARTDPLPVTPINVAPDPREVEQSAPAAAHKFDVGEGTGARAGTQDFARLREEAQSHIPWSYAQNKVTALPVDPDRLFVYWEVTQTAVDHARGALGPGGAAAWLSLRIYDVTGRLFDGNNAHSYFDQGVGNEVRQWFFQIGRPTSQAIVEIGLKSHEGYFAKIARSGRLEFPRKEPVAWSDPEWMTVQVGTGHVEGAGTGLAGAGHGASAGGPGGDGGQGAPGGGWGPGGGFGDPGGFETTVSMDSVPGVRRRIWLGRSHHELGAFEGQETWSWEEIDSEQLSPEVIQSFSWEGDSELTSWEAGPFEYPVEIPALVKERYGDSYGGPAKIFRTGGRTHVVWGPWQVIIKGLGGHAERRVISRWQMERAFTTRVWREVVTTGETATPLGSSGSGSSERWGRAGSELRLMGASERYTLGASELRFAGASERGFMGASQLLMRGATERLFRGASELAYAGASERRLGGASERRYAGASERRLGGASEWRLGGGSELRLGGSEGRLQGPDLFPAVTGGAQQAAPEPAPPAQPSQPDDDSVVPGSLWPVVPAAGGGR
jgi:hypothetical protein